jgi:cytochrome P450
MSIEAAVATDRFGKPETWENPYPAYRQFRDTSPLAAHWPIMLLDGTAVDAYVWMLLKYDQVMAALRDPATFSSQNPAPGSVTPQLVMISDDPPRHTRFRRLVNKAFTARRIAELEPWIKTVANGLLDQIANGKSVDAVDAFTMPLPVQVIARMLGIPGDDQPAFKRWSDSMIAFNGGDFTAAERVTNGMQMMDYFRQVAAARREQHGSDLISALVEADVEGERLEEWEILGFCILLLVAGNETTTNLMSNMLNIMVDRPDLWRRLREDRSRVEFAIEETLRYESPVQMLTRFTTRDIEIEGRQIFKGQAVAVSYGAGNRDPAVFPDPETFSLDRDFSKHLGFGAGIHYCLGAPLARVEASIMLNGMLDRYASIERADEAPLRQRATNLLLGFRKLPLKFIAQSVV